MERSSKNKIKKIGICWESEQIGGVDSYLCNLINTAAFSQIDIVLFTNKNNLGSKRLSKILKDKKINYVYFTSLNSIEANNIILKILVNLLKPILFFVSIFQFYFLLKNYKFDVFIGQCGGYGDFRSEMASMFAAKFLKFPVRSLVIHHACEKPIFWNTLLNIVNNLISKIVTSVISVSKATRDTVFHKSNLLDRSGDLKNLVIHNGIPINKQNNDTKKIDNIIYKDSDDILLLGMLSRIESYKGHMDLIEAFSGLSNNIQNKLKIYLIGDGNKSEIERLKRSIELKKLQKFFVITGYVECDSISIVSKHDLLISLTRTFEGFGLSIAEAMSVGTPVLSTKVGAVTEYLNSENSKLIQSSNIKELTSALNDFVVNKSSWDKKAEIGKKVIVQNFNSELMAKNYINHFNQNLS